MRIKQYMSSPALTILPTTTIPEARALLRVRNFRHLPVADEEGVLLGIVTDRDLRSAYPSTVLDEENIQVRLGELQQTPVSAIMSPASFTLTTEASIDDALIILHRENIGALPVVDQSGRILGIFSIRDLIGAYRKLFGLGERGSAMLTIEDDGRPRPLSRLCAALEAADIHFSRLVRTRNLTSEQPDLIHLRVTTYNLSAVRKVLAGAGFEVKS